MAEESAAGSRQRRLLLDANLSYRLVPALAAQFHGILHVSRVGLAQADDDAIWRYAKANDLAIVTFDSDFYDMTLVRG
jgi:predicted nuclease of predicted toxin-antitoxin system